MVTSFPTKLVMPAGISAPKLRMKFCITVTHRFLPFNRLSEAAFANSSIISGADLVDRLEVALSTRGATQTGQPAHVSGKNRCFSFKLGRSIQIIDAGG